MVGVINIHLQDKTNARLICSSSAGRSRPWQARLPQSNVDNFGVKHKQPLPIQFAVRLPPHGTT